MSTKSQRHSISKKDAAHAATRLKKGWVMKPLKKMSSRNQVTYASGPTDIRFGKSCTPLECFGFFFTDTIVDHIVEKTQNSGMLSHPSFFSEKVILQPLVPF
jgi:hypothetical protein